MRKIFIILSFILLSNYSIASSYYAGGSLGLSFSKEINPNSVYLSYLSIPPIGRYISASFGIKEKSDVNFRADLEILHSNLVSFNETQLLITSKKYSNTITQNYLSLFANAYIDFFANYKVRPFLGFGGGYIIVNEKISTTLVKTIPPFDGISATSNYNSSSFGLAGYIGISLTFSDSIEGDLVFKRLSSMDFGFSSLGISLRYTF